ncbi:hypothetical protein ACWEV4_33435, partial [Streptomyces sp. NPDC003860]
MKRSRTTALHQRTANWSGNRRIAVVAAMLAVLVAVAGLAAYVTGQADPDSKSPAPAAPANSAEPSAEASAGQGKP